MLYEQNFELFITLFRGVRDLIFWGEQKQIWLGGDTWVSGETVVHAYGHGASEPMELNAGSGRELKRAKTILVFALSYSYGYATLSKTILGTIGQK